MIDHISMREGVIDYRPRSRRRRCFPLKNGVKVLEQIRSSNVKQTKMDGRKGKPGVYLSQITG